GAPLTAAASRRAAALARSKPVDARPPSAPVAAAARLPFPLALADARPCARPCRSTPAARPAAEPPVAASPPRVAAEPPRAAALCPHVAVVATGVGPRGFRAPPRPRARPSAALFAGQLRARAFPLHYPLARPRPRA